MDKWAQRFGEGRDPGQRERAAVGEGMKPRHLERRGQPAIGHTFRGRLGNPSPCASRAGGPTRRTEVSGDRPSGGPAWTQTKRRPLRVSCSSETACRAEGEDPRAKTAEPFLKQAKRRTKPLKNDKGNTYLTCLPRSSGCAPVALSAGGATLGILPSLWKSGRPAHPAQRRPPGLGQRPPAPAHPPASPALLRAAPRAPPPHAPRPAFRLQPGAEVEATAAPGASPSRLT